MADKTQTSIDGRTVTIYPVGAVDPLAFPVVYSTDYKEAGEEILARCAELGCAPFNLVVVSDIEWDQLLSPWPHEPVVKKDDKFEGRSSEYLAWLLGTVVPCAEGALGGTPATSYVSGYSMAGLFAVWSLYQTDFFTGAICGSGSLWYPGMRDYALTHELAAMAQGGKLASKGLRGVYFSLGDRETKVKNPVLQTTEDVMHALVDRYTQLGIPCMFESNPGNHFRDVDLRMAKGLTWLLAQ